MTHQKGLESKKLIKVSNIDLNVNLPWRNLGKFGYKLILTLKINAAITGVKPVGGMVSAVVTVSVIHLGN